jgi:Tfp pilus assembly protein PilN
MSAGTTEQPTRQVPALRTIEWATVPRVNLLPPEIMERRRFRQLQLMLGAAVLAALVVAGALTYWATTGVTHARDDLAAAQTQVSTLRARESQYAEVPRVIAEVEAATAARAQVMAADVVWSRYLGDLDAALPQGAAFTTLTANVSGSTTAAATGTGVPAGIGTVSVAGTAPSYGAVSAWMDALDAVAGIDSPTLSGASKDTSDTTGAAVTFSTGAVVTDAALSHLYDGKAG